MTLTSANTKVAFSNNDNKQSFVYTSLYISLYANICGILQIQFDFIILEILELLAYFAAFAAEIILFLRKY